MQVQFIRKHVIKNVNLSFVENIFMLIRNYEFQIIKEIAETGIPKKISH